MQDENGWLCADGTAEGESWISDIPWFKANDRHGHVHYYRNLHGIQKAFDPMEFVNGAHLFRQVFYGNPVVTPGEITGFSARYNTRDASQAQNAICVLDGKGTKDLTSIWLNVWGRFSMYCVTPEGAPPLRAGLSELGLVVTDWRFARRIANVDADASAEELEALIISAILQLPLRSPWDVKVFRPTIYANAGIKARLGRNYIRGIFVREADLRDDEARVE